MPSSGRQHRERRMAWRSVPPGSDGAGHASRGSDGNSGDPVVSVLEKPVGEPGDQNPGPSWAVLADGGSEESSARTVPAGEATSAGMDGRKSERPIVPMRPGNQPEGPGEGRGRRGMEPLEGKMARTSDLGSISTRLHRIAELARQAPEMVIVTLAHHIDLAWMYEAYRQTRKDGAAGSDEVTAASTPRTSRETCSLSSSASSRGRTLRRRCDGCRFRKETGARPARSGYRPLRTRSCKGRC